MRKLVVALAILFSLGTPVLGYAQFSPDSSGIKKTAEAYYGGPVGDVDLNIATFIGNRIIKPVLGILGLLFLILTIYAGFLWMTAAGEEKKVEKAKEILKAAIIGAVIILSAYAITNSIFNALEHGSFATSNPPTE